MGVLGGIILIFLGIFMSVDGGLTKAFCVYDSASAQMICVDHALPTFAQWNDFSIAIGAILMMVGVGVILDNIIRWGEVNEWRLR